MMTKQNNAYFLSHNGLGDNITNIGAINFLSQYYETIYLLCKSNNYENLKLLFYNKPVVLVQFDKSQEDNECNKIIATIYDNTNYDIYISGWCHKKLFYKRRVTNKDIINYNVNKNYTIKYEHIYDFYNDLGLDLYIYYNYFYINSSEESIKLYNDIKHYKNIIFLHTLSSNYEVSLDDVINIHKDKDDSILICANKNVYDKTNQKYDICQKYVYLLVAQYIDIIKNASEIYVIDSCFSCIVFPLHGNKLINPKIFKIIERI